MIEKVLPSIVSIRVQGFEAVEENAAQQPAFGVSGNESFRELVATGSGVIVDAAGGIILTNDHVLTGHKPSR